MKKFWTGRNFPSVSSGGSSVFCDFARGFPNTFRDVGAHSPVWRVTSLCPKPIPERPEPSPEGVLAFLQGGVLPDKCGVVMCREGFCCPLESSWKHFVSCYLKPGPKRRRVRQRRPRSAETRALNPCCDAARPNVRAPSYGRGS